MMKKLLLIVFSAFVVSQFVFAFQRQTIPVFERATWNAQDAVDEAPGYDRKLVHLSQSVAIPASWQGKAVTFVALGANQEVWLQVNGHEAGHHIGGYTAFSFDITPYIKYGEENRIEADITNEHDANIPPLSADFTFFGGFYRDAYLLATEPTHISTTFFATNGVVVETPNVSHDKAELRLATFITNADKQPVRVVHLLNGVPATVLAKSTFPEMDVQSLVVNKPSLWSPDSPTLYTLTTRLLNKKGKVLDEVTQQIGLRYYSFDENGLFTLNGEPLRLIGTNRHQCYDGMGWATPDSIHRKDMQLIKDMGGNFLRVSHYPQDPLVMHLCDSLGILTSVEIPIVNAITESAAFTHNSLNMLEEMVWQNRNHPSVIMWGYMNEVLLRPPFKYIQGQWKRHWEYLMNVNKLSALLNNRLHELDEERYTFAAIHDYFQEYHECGLDTLADVIGHNIYSGWYSGKIEDLDAKIDMLRSQMGNRPMLMSEYGADCDSRLRSDNPLKFDYTTDYALLYHKHYLNLLLTTDKLAGGTAWNLNDFHSESRGGAIPHINCKGLVTTKREPKFTYYYYQSILAKDEAVRAEARRKMEQLMEMPVPQKWPLCVLLGSNRYYTDHEGLIWQPDHAYEEAPSKLENEINWGFVGGESYVRKTNHGPLPASDVTILGTHNWPVYQTARMGIREFRADVPDGDYVVTICLAELETKGEQEMSPYNLGNKALDSGFDGRRFTISVNGEPVIFPQPLLTYTATDIVVPVKAAHGQGILIALTAQQGATMLNALKIDKK